MAWIPLLLASWIVVDVLIVAIVLAVARRNRHREQQLRDARPVPEWRLAGSSVARSARSVSAGRAPLPLR